MIALFAVILLYLTPGGLCFNTSLTPASAPSQACRPPAELTKRLSKINGSLQILPEPWISTQGDNTCEFYEYQETNTYLRASILSVTDAAKRRLTQTFLNDPSATIHSKFPGEHFHYRARGHTSITGINIKESPICIEPICLSYNDVANTIDCIYDYIDAWCLSGETQIPTASILITRSGAEIADAVIERRPFRATKAVNHPKTNLSQTPSVGDAADVSVQKRNLPEFWRCRLGDIGVTFFGYDQTTSYTAHRYSVIISAALRRVEGTRHDSSWSTPYPGGRFEYMGRVQAGVNYRPVIWIQQTGFGVSHGYRLTFDHTYKALLCLQDFVEGWRLSGISDEVPTLAMHVTVGNGPLYEVAVGQIARVAVMGSNITKGNATRTNISGVKFS